MDGTKIRYCCTRISELLNQSLSCRNMNGVECPLLIEVGCI